MKITYGNKQILFQFGHGLTRVVGILIGLTILVFLIQQMGQEFLAQAFGFAPSYAVGRFMLWQFVTALFLHSNFAHLAFNMLALYMFGSGVEKILGGREFLKYYLLCGVGGFTLTYLLYLLGVSRNGVYIGASSAVYGLLAGYSILYAESTVSLFFLIPLKAKWLAILFGGVEMMFLLKQDGINHIGHLGGLITGLLYLTIFKKGNVIRRVSIFEKTSGA